MTMYDKAGNPVKVAKDQREIMKNAGFTETKPVQAAKTTPARGK